MTVVRRCVDIGDVLALATTGQAAVAIVSADLRRLDTEAVTRLRASGVAVVGVHPAADQRARTRLERIGITVVGARRRRHRCRADGRPDRGDRPGDLARAGVGLSDPRTAIPPPGVPVDVEESDGPDAAGSGGRRVGSDRRARAGPRSRPRWRSSPPQLGVPHPADRRRRLRRGGRIRVRPAGRIAGAGRRLPDGGQRSARPGRADRAVLVARRRPAAAHRHRPGRPVARGAAVGDPRRARRRPGDGADDRRRLRLRHRGRRGDLASTRWRRGATAPPWPCWPRPTCVLAVGSCDPAGLERLIRGLAELADAVPEADPQVVLNRCRSSVGLDRRGGGGRATASPARRCIAGVAGGPGGDRSGVAARGVAGRGRAPVAAPRGRLRSSPVVAADPVPGRAASMTCRWMIMRWPDLRGMTDDAAPMDPRAVFQVAVRLGAGEQTGGRGPFVSRVRWQHPDGCDRHLGIAHGPQARVHRGGAGRHRRSGSGPDPRVAIRLGRCNTVSGISFFLGGALFTLGAVLERARRHPGHDAQLDLPGRRLLLLHRRLRRAGAGAELAARHRRRRRARPRTVGAGGLTSRMRPGWVAAFVLFCGTLAFAISLVDVVHQRPGRPSRSTG